MLLWEEDDAFGSLLSSVAFGLLISVFVARPAALKGFSVDSDFEVLALFPDSVLAVFSVLFELLFSALFLV